MKLLEPLTPETLDEVVQILLDFLKEDAKKKAWWIQSLDLGSGDVGMTQVRIEIRGLV